MSEELAQKLGREDADRLLKDRKLVLLVDLDQTLVHTTNDNIPPNLKVHFLLVSKLTLSFTILSLKITDKKYKAILFVNHSPLY